MPGWIAFITRQADKRCIQHLSGLGSRYTERHPQQRLVYLEEYDNFEEVRRREKQIKSWERKKKEKLIIREWGKWQ